MKKFIVILSVLILVIVGALVLPKQEEYDYLRIHIRANSNSAIDQNVKYEIKDEVVKFLTPYLSTVPSKQKAIDIINTLSSQIENICEDKLSARGFNYKANVKINNEYFPTRTYGNTTLESGYYDAVIVELGEAKGDNWWCVMYPPLCFVNNFSSSIQIKYKSKIWEFLKSLFD